jgi:hypothetical protein
MVIIDAHNDVLLELLVGAGEEPSLELVLPGGPDRLFERVLAAEARGGRRGRADLPAVRGV